MSNPSDRKRQIKIYQRTYSLPVLGGGKLNSLQAEILSGSQNLQRGLLAGLAKNKTMEEINRVTLKLFEPVKPMFRKTMTFDNGREFRGHEKLSERLQIDTFFANPYHSWERGLNEHTNGFLSQKYEL